MLILLIPGYAGERPICPAISHRSSQASRFGGDRAVMIADSKLARNRTIMREGATQMAPVSGTGRNRREQSTPPASRKNGPMCSHYQAIKDRERFQKQFHVELPPYRGVYDYDVWPGYHAPFIRQPREAGAGDDAVSGRGALAGVFGLIPHWANDDKFARRTFNARSETAATLPSFRDAWRKGHKCIIPADAIFGSDWRSGKAIATRIRRRANGWPVSRC
jgi:hypothetical protein